MPGDLGKADIQRLVQSAGEKYATGQLAAAVEEYEKILQVRPDCYEALNNLGLILQKHNNFGRAETLFRQAIQASPSRAEAYNNLANIANQFGRQDRALALYEKAMLLKPRYAEAAFNAATVKHHLNDLEGAISLYKQAIDYKAHYLEAFCNLGMAMQQLGRTNQALDTFRKVLSIQPENPLASHMVASLGEGGADAAPRDYVRGLFDEMADNFEDTLVGRLDYDIPAELRRLVEPYLPQKKADRLLDLGCGTGLVGVCFQDRFEHLVGVDLSARMVDEARKKNIYCDLFSMDIVEFAKTQSDRYSLVVAADVFVYLGDLSELFSALSQILENEACFIFSLEVAEGLSEGYILQQTGRYAHSLKYVEQLSAQYGFTPRERVPANIRKEKEEWVPGACLVLQRAD